MMMNVCFRFLLVGIAAAMAAQGPDDNSKYLYRGDPEASAVQEYTELEGKFLASTQPRVVEFYSPFCGHCRTFKSHYVALAKETQETYPKVEFYSVSCVAHKSMCQQFKVKSYPSVLTFALGDSPPIGLNHQNATLASVVEALKLNADTGAKLERKLEDGNGSKENDVNGSEEDEDEAEEETSRDGFDVPDMEEDIADAPDTEEDISDVPDTEEDISEDPNLEEIIEEPLDSQDAVDSSGDGSGNQEDGESGEILDDAEDTENEEEGEGEGTPSDSRDAPDAPVMQKVQTFHGLKAGADAARASPLEMDRYKNLLNKQKIKNRHGGLSHIHKPEVESPREPGAATSRMKAYTPGTREFILREQRMAKQLAKKATRTKAPLKKTVTKPRFVEKLPLIKRVVRMSDEEALILDTTLSFIHGLQFGVFTSKSSLPAKKRRALKDWLDLLSVSLPAEWALHDLIDDLLNNMYSISESDENLTAILKKYPTPRAIWSESCRKGVSGGQFSCGVWKLLHTVTVGVAEYRGGLNLLQSEVIRPNTHKFSPLEAADTIRDYMENFFLCSDCSKNFVQTYDQCKNNRRCERLTDDAGGASSADWKELSAWLWEVHNDVSVRLLNERADKTRTKMQRTSAGRAVAGPGAANMVDEIKVLWPTLAECVTCFRDDGSWYQDGIFLFLEKTYWPGSDLDYQAIRLMSLDNVGPEGSKLTILLGLFGIALLFFMRKSLRSPSLQQTLLAARAMRPKGSVGAQKRSN